MHRRSIPLASPMEKFFKTLLDEGAQDWSGDPDFVVVWTRPEGVLGAFRDLLNYSPGKRGGFEKASGCLCRRPAGSE